MNPLPLPFRVAAGLLATAVEQARKLPEQLTELPVTAASRAIQGGMRIQQRVTALAVKGDEVLSLLRPVEDTPSWARFDEDDEPVPGDRARDTSDTADDDGLATVVPGPGARQHGEADEAMIARALTEDPDAEHPHAEPSAARPPAAQTHRGRSPASQSKTGESKTGEDGTGGARNGVATGGPAGKAGAAKPGGPAALPDYDELTLPQLRGKLRALTLPQLEALLEHENANRARPPFVTMLSNRIVTVRSQ